MRVPTYWWQLGGLLVVAVVLYYAMLPLLVFGTIVLMFWMLFWLCDRYPRTMLVMLGFWRGLTGR